jgi:hypothetical protein
LRSLLGCHLPGNAFVKHLSGAWIPLLSLVGVLQSASLTIAVRRSQNGNGLELTTLFRHRQRNSSKQIQTTNSHYTKGLQTPVVSQFDARRPWTVSGCALLVALVSNHPDAHSFVTTHAPALLRRIPPERIRYLRLDEDRETVVKSILVSVNSCLYPRYGEQLPCGIEEGAFTPSGLLLARRA